jgi:hypothetical protein
VGRKRRPREHTSPDVHIERKWRTEVVQILRGAQGLHREKQESEDTGSHFWMSDPGQQHSLSRCLPESRNIVLEVRMTQGHRPPNFLLRVSPDQTVGI